ncbi:MAG TPA: DUF1028 domain-containing protein [Steroidobacteraceae bacterium]|nr:DUF1028 domain-containing protein [Steroidobacteraceae bacterium]
MTFSIVARIADGHTMGIAIASSSPAVAARCAHARAAAGAVATQNLTDPALGPLILDALAHGATAEAALAQALRTTPFGAYRQLAVIGRRGPPAIHSGERALGTAAAAHSTHAAAAGNLLAHRGVPPAMLETFESTTGDLGARLLRALRAGLDAGGEAAAVHSAGLLIVRDVSWPIADLRVDWTEEDPVAQLSRIWERYAPQIEDYVRRAVDPAHAPGFEVAGGAP